MNIPRILVAMLVLTPVYTWAQDGDRFDWKIAPYLWAMSIDGSLAIGDLEQDLDVSFKDILSDFDIGGSVFAELGKGNHAVHVDYSYIRLKPDPTALPTPPFPPESELATKVTINIFEPAYNYRWNGAGGPAIVVGARYLDISLKMTPELTGPGLIETEPLQTGPNWWDFFIGVKTNNAISANWDFSFYGTIGTGESDLPWTLQAMFSRRYSNNNRLGMGVRIWGIDYSNEEGVMGEVTTIDLTFYGLLIGYEFN
jgi:hypothetical protein